MKMCISRVVSDWQTVTQDEVYTLSVVFPKVGKFASNCLDFSSPIFPLGYTFVHTIT